MARTLSRNRQTYPAGEYGPFSIDSFTKNDTDRMELELTVEGWPNAAPLMRIELSWDSGGGAKFEVSGPQSQASVLFSVGVPKGAGVKRDVSGGSVMVTTFAPITTALQLRAI